MTKALDRPIELTEDDVRFSEMRMELANVYNQLELTQEAMSDQQLWQSFDTLGWDLVEGFKNEHGPNLATVKSWTPTNRQMVAINPTIKRANTVRCSYIFGAGVLFGRNGRPTGPGKEFIESNLDTIFSIEACAENERCLNSDGQLFLLLDKSSKRVIRIPMDEITNLAVEPGNAERVLYFLRRWTEVDTDNGKTVEKKAWYPAPGLSAKERKLQNIFDNDSNEKIPVDLSKAILHTSVNRQVGWTLGVPDVQSVIFWARAYKEYLEANYTLTRALARFAWKVTSTTTAGAQRAATKMAIQPARDPATGRAAGSGASAIVGGGEDLVALNKAGANVNFDAGRPLASMVAAGMEVSVIALLSDPSIGNQSSAATLDIPTLKAMTARQSVYKRMFERVFDYFSLKTAVVFPPIQSDALHRMIQAIVTAASTNGLHPEEIRDMLVLMLRDLGIDPKVSLPKPGEYAEFVSGINPQEAAQAQQDLEREKINSNPGTKPENTPKGAGTGKRSPAGAMADGTHDSRKTEIANAVMDVLREHGIDLNTDAVAN